MSQALSSEGWGRLEAIFNQALDLDAAGRAAFLDQVCGNDSALREEVESLLLSSDQTLSFLASPIQELAQQLLTREELTGKTVGQYRVVRLLGEGGMGKVYLAERADDEYRCQVAIKVVSARTGGRGSMLLRFRAERQILATLQHPNIARLLDGGITPEGAPYLVMEYIDGIAIDEYCRKKNLSIDDRLRLFRKVSSAVEFAHHHLVVHRDIKPVNILVDGNGEPKLLDFGIAKLLDEDPGGGPSLRTRATESLMTPEYASPEQIRGEAVSTATDVYGLGVLLYELLSGERPFKLESRSPLEIARVICEKDPDPPSTASRRNPSYAAAELRKLGRDLDNIVLKAMRKEPAERYSSVALLSSDVEAFLEGYPVMARENGWIYRGTKFVRRHTAAVMVAIAAVLALIGFSVGMALLARRASLEKEKAQKEAEFLTSMFHAASPEASRGHEITARDLLDRGAQRIERELASEPQVKTPLLISIARAYGDLGAYDEGLQLLQKSFGKAGSYGGVDALDRAKAIDLEATLYRLKGEYRTAEPLFRQALSLRQKIAGKEDPLVASSLTNLGECLYLEGSDSESEVLLRKALALRRQEHPDDADDVRNYLALLLERKGKFPEAVQLLGEAVEITRRREGSDSPDYCTSLHNWASALIDIGDLKGAETKLRDVLVIRRKILGNKHPDLTYTLNNLGYVLLEQGEWELAGPFLKESLDIRIEAFGADNPMVAPSWNNWARYFHARGDYVEAEKYYRRALQLAERQSPENWIVAQIESNLGTLAFDRGDYIAAERLAESAFEMRQKLGSKDSPAIASSLLEIGLDRLYEGDASGAASLLQQALSIRQRKLSAGNPAILVAELRLGEALLVEGKFSEAGGYLKPAFGYVHAPPFPLPRWQVAEADADYALCEKALGRSAGRFTELHNDLHSDPHPAYRKDPGARIAELTRLWSQRAQARPN